MKNLCIVRNKENWPLCYFDKTRDGIGYGFLGCLPRTVMFVSEERAIQLIEEIKTNPKFTMPPYYYHNMNNDKIKTVRISHAKPEKLIFTTNIFVHYENEPDEHLLLDYFPDEISFTEQELIGLTHEQAKHLKFEKDKQFLQS